MYLAHENESILEHGKKVFKKMDSIKYVDENILKSVGLFHDWGKFCSDFQKYIKEDTSLTPKEKRRKRHSLVSGIAAAAALDYADYPPQKQFVAFYAVAKHHSAPSNINDLSSYNSFNKEKVKQKYRRVSYQIDDIQENARQNSDNLLEEFSEGLSTDYIAKYYKNDFAKLVSSYRVTSKTYREILSVWSSLTSADKKATIGVPEISTDELNYERIDEYVDTLKEDSKGIQEELNNMRESGRQEAMENVDKLENNIGKIELPTGFGKTLTGLSVGLRDSNNRDGPLIYALPFTTIIDQTDSVIKDIFSEISETSPEYTLHHYLADTRSVVEDYSSSDIQTMLAETWESEIILTTFVQLFESLAGPSNKQSLKIPRLEDSTVILDEPQALPHKWWILVNRLMKLLEEQYNAHIILMTATQPKIGQKYPYTENPVSLTEASSNDSFSFLEDNERVSFKYHPSLVNYLENPSSEGFELQPASKSLSSEKTSSVLSVCNTINSVITLSEKVQSETEQIIDVNKQLSKGYSEGKFISAVPYIESISNNLVEEVITSNKSSLISLTTNLRPIDRRILIQVAQKLIEKEHPVTVISTQLIEAGVDISFDKVYRDFSPMSSIIQSAGRCNRGFKEKSGEVIIWRLEGEGESKPPSNLVYEDSLLNPTRESLVSFDSPVSEYKMVGEAVEKYYEILHETEKPGLQSLANAVDTANFEKLSEESLIREWGEKVDVIVPVSVNETQLIEAYREISDSSIDFSTKYERLSRIRQVLQNRSVSVLVENTENLSLIKLDDRLYTINAYENPSQYKISHATGVEEPEISNRFI